MKSFGSRNFLHHSIYYNVICLHQPDSKAGEGAYACDFRLLYTGSLVNLLHRVTLGWHGGSYVTQLVGRLGDLGSTKTSDSYPVSSSSGRPDFPQRISQVEIYSARVSNYTVRMGGYTS
jgi:hypothetical protein